MCSILCYIVYMCKQGPLLISVALTYLLIYIHICFMSYRDVYEHYTHILICKYTYSSLTKFRALQRASLSCICHAALTSDVEMFLLDDTNSGECICIFVCL